jgi:hypothetical protein
MPGGRKQERTRTGPTYRLAEFMNKNWDVMVGRPNDEVGLELGFKGGNMISLWRTGIAKVSLERLGDVARLMGVDIAILFPLWAEQYLGDKPEFRNLLNSTFKRLVAVKEVPLLNTTRRVAKDMGQTVLDFDADRLRAIEAVLKDDKLRKDVLATAEKAGIIAADSADDDVE